MTVEESYLSTCCRLIEEQYKNSPTRCGNSFGEILCHELHTKGLTFAQIAEKWNIGLTFLGELVWDHCKRLDSPPNVNHSYKI